MIHDSSIVSSSDNAADPLVEAAIAKLPDQDCEIIIMRHYEQLSNQEIAQALDLTEPAASMRYLRALRRLKDLMTSESAND